MTDGGRRPLSGTRWRDRPAPQRKRPPVKRQPWRFYGRAAEVAQLRAVFLAPEFDLVAIRGHRRVGKSQLLDRVVRSLPEDRPMVRHSAFACNTPEQARDDLLHSLADLSLDGADGKDLSGLRAAAASLRSMPDILEHLLRGGVNVAVDWADRLLDDALPGLVREIGDRARRLRREDAPMAGAGVPLLRRRGKLVLQGFAQVRMREMLDALGPGAVGRSMLLEPWSAAGLVEVARDRGWLDRPRRLALVRAALGGMPQDWEQFNWSPAADFAAFPDDREWRLAFARYYIEEVLPDLEERDFVLALSEDRPEDWRILDYLAEDEEREIDTAAIHARLRDVPPERLDLWLAVMSEDLGLIGEVPATPGSEARRRWRICDPRRRFRYDVVRRPAVPVQWRYGRNREIERLAGRMEALEDAALAQLKRECGPAWPSAPAEKRAARVRPPSRKTVPVKRRAFAFAVTATGDPGYPERGACPCGSGEARSGTSLEGLLVPYGAPMCIGGAFEEVFEPGSVTANGLLAHVRHEWGAPLARSGKGLELHDGPEGLRATVSLPDTGAGRRVRARVEAGELTAFSAAFQMVEDEWPAADRRIVRQARLVGLALVERPEHETPLVDGGNRGRPEAC